MPKHVSMTSGGDNVYKKPIDDHDKDKYSDDDDDDNDDDDDDDDYTNKLFNNNILYVMMMIDYIRYLDKNEDR